MLLNLFRPIFVLFFGFFIDVFPGYKLCELNLKCLLKKLILILFVLIVSFNGVVIGNYAWNIRVTIKNLRVTWVTLAQFLLTIQSILLFLKRKSIRKTIKLLDNYLEPFYGHMMNGRVKKFQIIIYVMCAIVLLKHVALSQLLYLSLTNVFKLGKWMDISLNILCFVGHSNFAIIDCFLLYYCTVCWVLKRAFLVYITLLDKNLKDSRVLDYYSRITQAVSHVDFTSSNQIFWIFLVILLNLFCQTYILVHESTNIYEVALNSWSAVTLFGTVMSAAFVGESADLVKQYVAENNSTFPPEIYNQLSAKMTGTENHLTIWNMFTIKRVTIFNVAGTFITYAVIML